MGSSTNKTTSSTGSSSPAVKGAIDKLAGGLSSLYTPGGTSYVAPSSTTTAGWNKALDAAGNPAYSSGIGAALSSYANRAAGNEIGMNDPGYMAIRDKLQSDITEQTNSSFANAGLFGSDSNQSGLAEGLASGLGGLDYQQYQNSLNRQSEAANMLPQLFAGGQLPASIMQSVGASMDQNAQAQEAGKWDYLNRATGTLTGAAGAAGTTTTTSTPTAPLWQQLLGAGISLF